MSAESPTATLAAFFDQIPCGLVLLDASHAILNANLYAERTLGYPRDSLKFRRFHEILTVAGRLFVQSRLWPELALAGRAEEIALDILDAKGIRVPVLMNITQAKDADGHPGEIQIAFTRALAKRAYEAEVPRARAEAAAAAQVKADFLANVSHELRTPLNAIVGGADALITSPLAPEQAEIVELVQASGLALQRIVSDILEMSRIDASQLSVESAPFDLLAALQGTLDLTGLRTQEKGLGLDIRIGAGAQGQFLGDSVRIGQILGHLTSNAVKFTNSGTVQVRIDVTDATDDELFVLEVEDTGIGFDDASGDLLFDRFQQAETGLSRDRGGVGLGLALCKRLTELMGGRLRYRSAPGEGSCFSVSLPLRRTRQLKDLTPTLDPDLVGLAGRRVLVVEDQASNRKIVQVLLSRQGATCEMAENGLLGIEAWRSGLFDLVLMDLQMPVMDGLTAIRHIRDSEKANAGPRTPIAVLSANAMAHHRREALEVGADIHIAKPITSQTLIAGMKAAITASHSKARLNV